MPRPNKRTRSTRGMVKERERRRKIRRIQEGEARKTQERGWESSEQEEDITAIGMQGSIDLESDESEDDEVMVSEGEEQEQADESAFGQLMASAIEESRCVWPPSTQPPSTELIIYRETSFGGRTVLKYQRSHTITKRHQRRLKQQQREREKTMGNYKSIPELFRNAARIAGKGNNSEVSTTVQDAENGVEESSSTISAVDGKGKKKCPEELKALIADLEKKLRSKNISLTGQNSTRHQAVLRFLYYQRMRQHKETRESMALRVASCFNRGKWFAEKLISWEISWRKDRTIPKGKQGCFQKVKSWLRDEGVELAVREYLSGAGENK